jgi:hypothetical protein
MFEPFEFDVNFLKGLMFSDKPTFHVSGRVKGDIYLHSFHANITEDAE